MVAVDVDHRELDTPHRMLRHDKRRADDTHGCSAAATPARVLRQSGVDLDAARVRWTNENERGLSRTRTR